VSVIGPLSRFCVKGFNSVRNINNKLHLSSFYEDPLPSKRKR
jgi:hypothetical protein